MIRTESRIRVRYSETDAMGFAHHANYVTWFEKARIEMLDQIGLAYRDLEASGYFIPVLEVKVSYRRPAFFDDRLTVACMVKEQPGVRFYIEYEVRRGETLLANGSSAHAFINKSAKPIRPPQRFLNTMKAALRNGIPGPDPGNAR